MIQHGYILVPNKMISVIMHQLLVFALNAKDQTWEENNEYLCKRYWILNNQCLIFLSRADDWMQKYKRDTVRVIL